MKKQLMSIILIISIMVSLLPSTAIADSKMTSLPAGTLYKVDYRDPKADKNVAIPDIWNNWNAPYRLTAGGDIQGEIPWGTVVEATASDGIWLKVKYAGRDCYIYHDKVSKVTEPDIVCSPWAKEKLSYYNGYIGSKDQWPNAINDWTKPITRADMIEMVFLLFRNGGAPYEGDMPFYKKEQFTDIKFNEFIGGKNVGSAANYLASMGLIPGGGKLNPHGSVSYQEFSDTLMKLAVYVDKYFYDGNMDMLSKSKSKKFNIGGDTSPGAKFTMEQARILCDEYNCWYTETLWLTDASYSGANLMNTGLFTMNVNLGKYPNQPYVVINSEGKAELSNKAMQKFKVTYKKTLPAMDPKNALLRLSGIPMMLFTIQSEDGKYLAINGLPSNGGRLITQNEEFLWWINSNALGFSKVNIMVPGYYDQRLNASGRSTKDGTHLVTWYEENKWKDPAYDKDYPFNSEFIFYMVHGPNSNTPTVASKHNHGPYIQSYPLKTTYKVGEGFDNSGFKMMYLDGNDGWKTKDITATYKFYTADGVELTQGRPFTTPGRKIVEIIQPNGNSWAHRITRGRYFITVN